MFAFPAGSARSRLSGGMSFPRVIAFLIVVADLALGGLISNGFMVATMVTEWTEQKRLGPNGQLLLSVGLSNVCSTFSMATIGINCCVSNCGDKVWFQKIVCFAIFVTCFRLWLAAWLCAFYYIKIGNSSCSFIVWCKLRISRLMPQLLMGTLLISICISSFAGFSMAMDGTWSKRTGNFTNRTQGKEQIDIFSYLDVLTIICGNACPFVIVLLCSALSIASLCRHLRRMRNRESSFETFQLKAHIRAVRTMVTLLFLYISSYVLQTLISDLDTWRETTSFQLQLVLILFSPLQAAVLLLANPKLKGIASQILRRTRL